MSVQINLALVIFVTLCSLILADRQHPYIRPTSASGRSFEAAAINDNEKTSEYWQNKAREWLVQKVSSLDASETQVKRAKNIIIFLGDGMSIPTLSAARAFMGDTTKQLSFDQFPYVGFSRTYCVDKQVADSACSATAYLGGVKGNYGTIGVNGNVLRGNCQTGTNSANFVDSIAKWAQDANKATGLVTTARVTHASPAGVYAHTADRDWENNAEVVNAGCNDREVRDIAYQLVHGEVGKKLNVVMGGGRQNFRPKSVNDEEGFPNKRTDGINLINQWLENKKAESTNSHYVWSRKGLSLLHLNTTDNLLGLFSNNHCPYNGDLARDRTTGVYPTLTEMTEAAIQVLQRGDNGFFLFVEGARIDMAHHDVKAHKSLEDTVEFSNAIKRAREMTSVDDTLIVVTSDHSHTLTLNGYPNRGSSVTGLIDTSSSDGIPHTIVSYANGPGYIAPNDSNKNRLRTSFAELDVESANYLYPSAVPRPSETHGGDDVGVFASGPFAHYFSGNYEQSNIPAMMARAASIGPYASV